MREEQRPRAFETTMLEKYLGVRGIVIKSKIPQTCFETIGFSRRNLSVSVLYNGVSRLSRGDLHL